MTVAFSSKLPNVSPEKARQVIARVRSKLGHKGPEGALYHAEGPTDAGGWWSFTVWESDAAAQRFAEEYLNPALTALDIPIPEEERLPVEWETSAMRPDAS